MDLTVRQEGHVTVVDISGPIILGEGDSVLRESLFRLLDDNHRNILINLENVPHVDSAALGELGASFKHARNKNSEVKLLSPSPTVADLLQLVKFDDLFEIHDDERAAIASFGQMRG